MTISRIFTVLADLAALVGCKPSHEDEGMKSYYARLRKFQQKVVKIPLIFIIGSLFSKKEKIK